MRMLLSLALILATSAGATANANAGFAESAAPARITLQRGTVIPLVLRQALSSRTNVKGDLFEMVVAADVRVGERVLIPAGSRAVGELTRCEPKGAFGRSGKIEARALYVVIGNRTIRTTGLLAARGEGAPAETVLATVAAGALSFIVTGKSATLAAGTAMAATLDQDVEI